MSSYTLPWCNQEMLTTESEEGFKRLLITIQLNPHLPLLSHLSLTYLSLLFLQSHFMAPRRLRVSALVTLGIICKKSMEVACYQFCIYGPSGYWPLVKAAL
uniref:Uncharacterized protein n=1 Tax=Opuntia streptacantha TaxID=393608 RepID=A0A7C9AW41_OPUST